MSGPAEPYGREGLALDDARDQVLAAIQPLPGSETLPLAASLGRVSARTVRAAAAVPGFRASIMDGFALGQDTQPTTGESWVVRGCSSAGNPFEGQLSDGESIRILTGAPLPEGAGWVLPQELVERTEDTITLVKDASDRPWIRAADEECKPDDVLLESGQRLGPSDLGRLAGCGVAELLVHRQPTIGLLISGDELVPAGSHRQPGAIWESNGTLLETMLRSLGQTVTQRCVVADQPAALSEALQTLAAQCDVVVSTGGVSAGDSDWIRPLVADLGEVAFWKLFLRPGRPFAFGTLGDDIPFFGLPGNPVAAAITALQLLWPALQQLEGQTTIELFPRVQVVLANRLARRPGRPELARARLETREDGTLMARVDGSQASSRIGSLQQADLLLEVPADAGTLDPGVPLWAQLIRRRLF
ncbi:MAG: molybdopterin molybdenumtransferase MoeA [Gammaproteobacteria bacterium]|nr:molybdopterin molybdenumtransferase MoeA [Gammaproteobacteria bacterium]